MDKKTGKPLVWVRTTDAKMAALKMEEAPHPWTEKPGVQLRGLRQQASQPNFLHRLVDLRWQLFCEKNNIDPLQVPPPDGWDVITDRTQAIGRQKVNGLVTMLTRSVLYVHTPLDRVLAMREHFMLMGWPRTVDLSQIGNNMSDEWLDLIGEDPKRRADGKRRRKPPRNLENVGKQLIGAAMALPDLCLLLLAGHLAGDNDIFERHLPNELMDDAESVVGEDDCHTGVLVVDPDNISRLRMVLNKGGEDLSDFGMGGMGDDGDSEVDAD